MRSNYRCRDEKNISSVSHKKGKSLITHLFDKPPVKIATNTSTRVIFAIDHTASIIIVVSSVVVYVSLDVIRLYIDYYANLILVWL